VETMRLSEWVKDILFRETDTSKIYSLGEMQQQSDGTW